MGGRKNPMDSIREPDDPIRFDPYYETVYVCATCGKKMRSLSASEADMSLIHKMESPDCFPKKRNRF